MAIYTLLPSNSQPPLTTVPIEVLFHITYHLTTPDLCNLRLACKAIETSLLESFTREFFTKRQFMLSTFSLQALLDISRSRFAYCLKHVILSSEHLSADALNAYAPITDRQNGLPRPVDVSRLRREQVGRKVLLNTGQDIEMLAEALSNLSNIQTVGIRDFYSNSRRRDHPHTQWRSYGVTTFEIATGVRLVMQPRQRYSPAEDINNYVERLFLNVLRALGQATTRPSHLEVILRKVYLDDFAFTLPKHVLSTVEPALLSLRTIFLDLAPDDFPTQVADDGKTIPCPNYQLRLFLSRVLNLEHLRLNFHNRSLIHDIEHGLPQWLGQPTPTTTPASVPDASIPSSPPAVMFANLKQLDLGHFRAEPRTLISIIKKYRATLRGISFHEVTLALQSAGANNGHKPFVSSTAPAYAAAIEADGGDDDEPKPNYWATFFSQLSRVEQLDLSSLTLSRISVEEESFSHHCLFRDSGSRDPRVRHWAGNNIQSGLRDLAALVYVDRPKPVSVLYPQVDESDEDDGDNEDGDNRDDDDEDGDNEDDDE